MKLADSDIKEFQKLYEKHFHRRISNQEAEVEALKVIQLVSLIQPKKRM
jgi:hypothetical protein